MKKKLILLSIILFPSLIYLFFEMTQANFKKMAYFGPKTVDAKGDTVYWSVENIYFNTPLKTVVEKKTRNGISFDSSYVYQPDKITTIDTTNFPVYVILFIDSKLKKEGYKLNGLYDFIKYKSKDIKDVPVFVVSDLFTAIENRGMKAGVCQGDFDSLKITLPNFHPLLYNLREKEKTLNETYFKQKPIYVFDYFMVLVDKKRHIRGYYDPTFNAEITRMVKDYKHLKIRDEYAQTLKQNDIEQK